MQWVIIELQGTLHNPTGEPLNGHDLGTLQWMNVSPVPVRDVLGKSCVAHWKPPLRGKASETQETHCELEY